jgi:Family of unknown function (DUF6266)
MAKMPNGINGPFIGKLGTAVGYYWKGVPVVRSMSSTRTKPFSEAELAQQKKFGMMSKFLSKVDHLLNITFAKGAIGKSGYSVAFSYHMKKAITGKNPDFFIDYSAVKLSIGNLLGLESPAAIYLEENTLQFTWTNNSDNEKALSSDRAFVAVYAEDTGRWLTRYDIANRFDGIYKMNLGILQGTRLHTWIGLMPTNGKEPSDSVYTGMVERI